MNSIALYFLLAFLAWWAFSLFRERVARGKLHEFFAERSITIVEIRRPNHTTYGYPGYAVVFPSRADADAFKQSPQYEEFLQAVQKLHAAAGSAERPFDARMAITLAVSPKDAA